MGKARIMQAEIPEDDSMFFSIFFRGVKSSSVLSTSINLPDVTINPGYVGTCNHTPKEAVAITLSKPVAAVESTRPSLHNRSEETMSDPQRLKMWKI